MNVYLFKQHLIFDIFKLGQAVRREETFINNIILRVLKCKNISDINTDSKDLYTIAKCTGLSY